MADTNVPSVNSPIVALTEAKSTWCSRKKNKVVTGICVDSGNMVSVEVKQPKSSWFPWYSVKPLSSDASPAQLVESVAAAAVGLAENAEDAASNVVNHVKAVQPWKYPCYKYKTVDESVALSGGAPVEAASAEAASAADGPVAGGIHARAGLPARAGGPVPAGVAHPLGMWFSCLPFCASYAKPIAWASAPGLAAPGLAAPGLAAPGLAAPGLAAPLAGSRLPCLPKKTVSSTQESQKTLVVRQMDTVDPNARSEVLDPSNSKSAVASESQ
jgi:hypothetical protein